MAIKKKPEEHENHERWLVSYADFITLLFAFFVVMYSVSDRDAKKVKQLQVSLVKSFDSHDSGPMENQSGRPFTSTDADRYAPIANNQIVEKKELLPPERIFDEEQPLRILEHELERLIQAEAASRAITLTQIQRGLVLSFREEVFFEEGNTNIRAAFKPALSAIVKKLRGADHDLAIEGVAVPNAKRSIESGYQLLNQQCISLRRFIVEEGLSEERIEFQVVQKNQFGHSRADELGDGSTLDLVVLRKPIE